MASSGRKLYYLLFLVQAVSLQSFGYTLCIFYFNRPNIDAIRFDMVYTASASTVFSAALTWVPKSMI
jgi:hypothetical protein